MITTSEAVIKTVCQPTSVAEGLQIADQLIKELSTTAGIGLAANQINIHKRVFVLSIPDDENSLYLTTKHINPVIHSLYEPHLFNSEGCLSYPDTVITTIRYNQATVSDLLRPEPYTLRGIHAVAFQHELDHLDGKTMFESKPKEIGPNSRCPCKSGKKFKACCRLALAKKGVSI